MGALKQAMKPMIKQALTSGGAYLGGATGIPGGSMFGRELGAKISKLVGSGDYETNVSVNELINPSGSRASASFGEDLNTVRIRRREFIGDISTSAVAGAFVNYTYPINAGIRSTFPFLSQVACNYEEYCFDGLVFEFVSSSSPYIAATALGTVVAAMEYNASAPAYTTKYAMENSALAVSARLDKNLMYGVECAKGSNVQNCYYTRSGSTTLPLTTMDLGVFQLALAPSSGVTASSVVGELWVTYNVLLKRPVLNASRSAVYHSYTQDATALLPLGNTQKAVTSYGAINVTWTPTSFTLNNVVVGDVYFMDWSFTGTVAANLVYPVLSITGTSPFNWANNDTAASVLGPPAGTSSLVATNSRMMVATSTTITVGFGTAGTLPTGTIFSDLLITMVGNPITATGF